MRLKLHQLGPPLVAVLVVIVPTVTLLGFDERGGIAFWRTARGRDKENYDYCNPGPAIHVAVSLACSRVYRCP